MSNEQVLSSLRLELDAGNARTRRADGLLEAAKKELLGAQVMSFL
jgi:hypothetical protein